MTEQLAARCDALKADEDLILQALTDTYQRGEIPYLYYSPAFDVAAARSAALSWQAAAYRRDSGSGPSGRKREPAPGEAPQSGLSDSEGIAQPEAQPKVHP